jgi:CBS domain-containing protein
VYEFLDYRVCDAMTRDPVTVGPGASLAETEAIFERHDFNALPVAGPGGELLGVVTKLDLLRAFRFTDEHMFPPYEQVMAGPVREVMTTDITTVTQRTPLTRVLETLVRTRMKSLPVVEDGRVIGMIAREDVLAALRRAVAGERPTGPL